jgi:hypothetical protein
VDVSDRRLFAYPVITDAGERYYVAMVEPEWVDEHGLPLDAILGLAPHRDLDELEPAEFRENGPFLRFLSRVIWEDVDRVEVLQLEAAIQGRGHVYLLDGRNPNRDGRVPAEDVVGTVRVEDGLLVPQSFEHNPRHRLLTARGFFRLPAALEAALDRKVRAPTGYVLWPDEDPGQ